MKTQITDNYARVLYELEIPAQDVEKSDAIFAQVEKLIPIFENPVIPEDKKRVLIDRIFPERIQSFLKVVMKHKEIGAIREIFAAYQEYCNEQKKVIAASISYVEPPSEEQLEKMKTYICKRYGAEEVRLEEKQDTSLVGGFILRVGNDEYDYSMSGRLNRMTQKLTGR
nr:ATP synthase F1 subunit delta [Hespellia stercorisuis]